METVIKETKIMTQVQVIRKELSNGLQAVLVTINGVEGMTMPEVVRVLGIPEDTIRSYRRAKAIEFPLIPTETLQQLRTDNVISMVGRPPKFVPKEIVKNLVRFYSNEKTDAIYRQLWDVAQAVHSGDLRRASLDVGVSEDDTLDNLEKALKLARQYKAERDAAMTLIKTQKDYAANHATTHGLRSVDVLTKYPEGSTALIEETKPKIKNVEAFGPTGILTTGLKRYGLKPKVWTANKSGTKVALFNAEEVETFMSKYKETK